MKLYLILVFLMLASIAFLGGCKTEDKVETPQPTPTPIADFPKSDTSLKWDDKHRNGKLWTQTTLDVIDDSNLPDSEPSDMAAYCPNYKKLSRNERGLVWANMAVAIAKRESGFKPDTVYKESNGVDSIGLFQLSYGDRFCPKSKSKGDLRKGTVNITCAVKLMDYFVKQDNVVASGGYVKYGAKPPKGLARYWSVIRDDDKKGKHHKREIQSTVKALSFCNG